MASAKTAFDAQNAALREAAADVILLDHSLRAFGPETQPAREETRKSAAFWLHRVWPEDGTPALRVEAAKAQPVSVETVEELIRALAPVDDRQRAIQARALGLCEDLAHTRWLLFGQIGVSPVPSPFLFVLEGWLAILFVSFGMLAPPNPTVTSALFLSALSAAAAIFLILELGRPFEGLMKVSSAPLRDALAAISR